jgi:hypothetical protein
LPVFGGKLLRMLGSRQRWRSETSSFLDWLTSCFQFVCSPAHTEDMAMENGIGFVAVAGAIFASFAVALGMEWLSLVLLMKLMPMRPAVQTVAQRTTAVAGERGNGESERRAA